MDYSNCTQPLPCQQQQGGDSAPAPAPAGPSSTTVTNTNLPDYAQPAMLDLIGRSQALSTQNPYVPYSGQRVAGFNNLQNQSFQNIGAMQPAWQTGAASTSAGQIGQNAQNFNYGAPQQFNAGYSAPQYQRQGIGALDVNGAQTNAALGNYNAGLQNYQMGGPQQVNGAQTNAALGNYNAGLQNYQMGGPQQVGTGQFTDAGQAGQYMNPYMRNVVDYQKSEAIRDYQKSLPQEQAKAASQGAFGGNRQALNQSEMQRNLNTQLGGITAIGANNAYGQAQQAYMTDQARALQAQQANQGAGLTAQGQSLQQNANQANLNANTANAAAQYNLAGQQAQEQSRQFGANAYLQAGQLGLSAANQLGNMGQLDYNQRMGIIQGQNVAGTQQQQNTQQNLNNLYQDYATQQNYPYKQLGFMSDILHGASQGVGSSTQSMYQAAPTTSQNLLGLGLGLGGGAAAYKAFSQKEGGIIGLASGGELMGRMDAYSQLSPEQQARVQPDTIPKSLRMALDGQNTQLEMAAPNGLDQGIGALSVPDVEAMQFKEGGILRFADEGIVPESKAYRGPYPLTQMGISRRMPTDEEREENTDSFQDVGEVLTLPVGAGAAKMGFNAAKNFLFRVPQGATRVPGRVPLTANAWNPAVTAGPLYGATAGDIAAGTGYAGVAGTAGYGLFQAAAHPNATFDDQFPALPRRVRRTYWEDVDKPNELINPAVKTPDIKTRANKGESKKANEAIAQLNAGKIGKDVEGIARLTAPTLTEPKDLAATLIDLDTAKGAVRDSRNQDFLDKMEKERSDMKEGNKQDQLLGLSAGLLSAAGAATKPGQPYAMQAVGSAAEAFSPHLKEVAKARNDARKAEIDMGMKMEAHRIAVEDNNDKRAESLVKQVADSAEKYQTAKLRVHELGLMALHQKNVDESTRISADAAARDAATRALLQPAQSAYYRSRVNPKITGQHVISANTAANSSWNSMGFMQQQNAIKKFGSYEAWKHAEVADTINKLATLTSDGIAGLNTNVGVYPAAPYAITPNAPGSAQFGGSL